MFVNLYAHDSVTKEAISKFAFLACEHLRNKNPKLKFDVGNFKFKNISSNHLHLIENMVKSNLSDSEYFIYQPEDTETKMICYFNIGE